MFYRPLVIENKFDMVIFGSLLRNVQTVFCFSFNKFQGSSARENIKEISVENPFNGKRWFSLIQPRSSKSLCDGRGAETGNHTETSFEKLGSGMIILKNYISLSDQVYVFLSLKVKNYIKLIMFNFERLIYIDDYT